MAANPDLHLRFKGRMAHMVGSMGRHAGLSPRAYVESLVIADWALHGPTWASKDLGAG